MPLNPLDEDPVRNRLVLAWLRQRMRGVREFLAHPNARLLHARQLRRNVTVACGFSGHGFKFSSVIGEILADLAEKGETEQPIGLFSLKRFGG